MERPFRCSRCGNWYTPAERTLEEMQAIVESPIQEHMGSHRHIKEKPSTYAEALAGDILMACEAAAEAVHQAEQGRDNVALVRAKDAIAHADTAVLQIPRAEQYADKIGLFVGKEPEVWYGVAELRQRVGDHRRPPSDLADAQRSARVVPEAIAAALAALRNARAGMAAMTVAVTQPLSQAAAPGESVALATPPAAVAPAPPPVKKPRTAAQVAATKKWIDARNARRAARKQLGQPSPTGVFAR